VIKHSMEMIAREGKGVILYLQTEGKGLRPGRMTYPKVDGRKKKDMNRSFVYQSDFREYGIGAQILRDLGVRKMRLLTNNRKNLVGLSGYGLEVTALIPFPWQVPFTKQAGRKQRKG
ncbi:MAG: bifunctional 3,4-dihydroxy-2-butanone-4-phosphate synthase/GTP cyclohydrolase II, partial [Candidatus Binatota bacterium]